MEKSIHVKNKFQPIRNKVNITTSISITEEKYNFLNTLVTSLAVDITHVLKLISRDKSVMDNIFPQRTYYNTKTVESKDELKMIKYLPSQQKMRYNDNGLNTLIKMM